MKLDVYFHAGDSLQPAIDALKSRTTGTASLEAALRQVLKVATQQTAEIRSIQAQGQEMARRISELELMVDALQKRQQQHQGGIEDLPPGMFTPATAAGAYEAELRDRINPPPPPPPPAT